MLNGQKQNRYLSGYTLSNQPKKMSISECSELDCCASAIRHIHFIISYNII